MHCLVHPDREAVGTCSLCQRGVCTECGAGLGKGLSPPRRDRFELLAAIASAFNMTRTRSSWRRSSSGLFGLLALALALRSTTRS